jgi:hypothetical protein
MSPTPTILLLDQDRVRLDVAVDSHIGLGVGGALVKSARSLVGPAGVIAALVSFPLGLSKSTVKAIEATAAVKDGASEILVAPRWSLWTPDTIVDAKQELLEIVRGARAARGDVRIQVLVDPAQLAADIPAAFLVRIVRESACDGLTLLRPAPALLQSTLQSAGELFVDLIGESDIPLPPTSRLLIRPNEVRR